MKSGTRRSGFLNMSWETLVAAGMASPDSAAGAKQAAAGSMLSMPGCPNLAGAMPSTAGAYSAAAVAAAATGCPADWKGVHSCRTAV